jgi:hypothetical protein
MQTISPYKSFSYTSLDNRQVLHTTKETEKGLDSDLEKELHI